MFWALEARNMELIWLRKLQLPWSRFKGEEWRSTLDRVSLRQRCQISKLHMLGQSLGVGSGLETYRWYLLPKDMVRSFRKQNHRRVEVWVPGHFSTELLGRRGWMRRGWKEAFTEIGGKSGEHGVLEAEWRECVEERKGSIMPDVAHSAKYWGLWTISGLNQMEVIGDLGKKRLMGWV